MGLLLGFMEIVVALCLCLLITEVITQPANSQNENLGFFWPSADGRGARVGSGGGHANDSATTGEDDAGFPFPIPTPYFPTPVPLTCSQRDRCSKRISDDALPFHSTNCFCDDLCQTYGDCCKDYGRSSGQKKKFKLAKSTVSCERRLHIYKDSEIYIVKSCPKNYLDNYVKEKCEDERARDEFYQLPATGTNTGVLYRNVFCALCAGDTNVTFWNVKVNCANGPTEGTSSPDSSQDSSDQSTDSLIQSALESPSQNCELVYVPPAALPFRKCKSHYAKCDRKWRDKKVERKCKSYTSFVYASLHVFKNKHCGICNYVNETYLSCEDTRTPFRPDGEQGGVPEYLPPFSIMLDINLGTGTVAENRVGSGGIQEVTETVVEVRRCADGQVYNPFSEVCVQVFCPAGQQFFGGQCQEAALEVTTAALTPEESAEVVQWTTEPPAYTVVYGEYTQPMVDNSYDIDEEVEDGGDLEDEYINTGREKVSNVPDPVSYDNSEPVETFDCPLILLNRTEFILLRNDSIYYLGTKQVYNLGEFFHSGPNVYICTPFIEQSYNVTTNVTTIVEMFKFSPIQSLVSLVGIIISLTALLILFVVYMMLPPLRNLPGKCLISLVVALFLAQCLFVVGTPRTEIPQVCITLAAVMHYCFLAAFLWINVLAIDICRTFAGSAASAASAGGHNGHSKRFAGYSFYAWLVPALIVGGSVALDLFEVHELYRPHYGEGLCWITSRRALLALFALPMAIILFVNILLFTATIVHICAVDRLAKKALHNHYNHSSSSAGSPSQLQKEKGRFILYIKLSFIMGLTWVFGFLAALTDIHVLWYVFIVFNTLQGAFICLAFVCTKKVFRLLRKKGRVHRSGNSSNTRYTNCYANSSNSRLGYTRPTYLFDGEARVIAQETSI